MKLAEAAATPTRQRPDEARQSVSADVQMKCYSRCITLWLRPWLALCHWLDAATTLPAANVHVGTMYCISNMNSASQCDMS